MILAGVLSFIAKGIWWFGFIVGAVVATVVMSFWEARKGMPDKGQVNLQGLLVVAILVVILLIVLRAAGII